MPVGRLARAGTVRSNAPIRIGRLVPVVLPPPPKVITKVGPRPISALGGANLMKAVVSEKNASISKAIAKTKPYIPALNNVGAPTPASAPPAEAAVSTPSESQSAEPQPQNEAASQEPAESVSQEDESAEYDDEGEEDEDEIEVEDDDEEDDSCIEGEPSVISAHVHQGVLHSACVVATPHGYTTVTTRVPCKGDQEGLVNFHGDNPEWLNHAIDKTKQAIAFKSEAKATEKEIGSLVRRARTGDQNAMGIIAMVRARAQAGDETAKRSASLMRNYIDNHPATGEMGSELSASPKANAEALRAMIVLANGPPLNNSRISDFQAQFGEEKHRKAFLYGVMRRKPVAHHAIFEKKLDDVSKSALDIGRIVGEARAVQSVRQPNSKISKFDAVTGWELGE